MTMRPALAILILTFFGIPADSTETCKSCQHSHPQPIICKADFVGIIRITRVNLENSVRLSSFNNVTAEATILQIFKGPYQDFEAGSSIYLYAPPSQDCKQLFWKEDFLISGKSFNGGLISTICDLRESRSLLSEKQLKNIRSHLRHHAYDRGCQACSVKKLYDYSPVQANECQYPFNEFPMSTSACMPNQINGKCSMVRTSRQQHIKPRQGARLALSDFEGVNVDGTTAGNGCLINRITDSATNSSPIPEEPSEVPQTTERTVITPKAAAAKRKVFRMVFDWSKYKSRRNGA